MRISRRSKLFALPLLLSVAFAFTAIGGGPGTKGYTFLPIDDPDAGPFGTSVFGINSPGVMVGSFGETEGVFQGFLLRAGQFTTLAVDDSLGSDLYDVNSQGTASGDFVDDQGNLHGLTYSADGTIAYLPDPAPGASSSPLGINSQGAVVGLFSVDGYTTAHGYTYERGSFTYVDVPGSSYTVPWRISNSGTVCGYFFDGQDNAHGFLRDRKGNFTQVDVPGAAWTTIYGLNAHGDIVGAYGDGTTYHGYLLRKGVVLTLDYPEANNTEAFDINDAGDIVGTYNDFSRGFLATPSK
jgi:uncharacterized membrane protein